MKLACVWIAAAILTSFSVQAQGQPSPEELQRLQALADQVKAALQRGDLDAAVRPAADLMSGIVKQRQAAEPSPAGETRELEQTAPMSQERFYALAGLAKAAFDAGEFDKAESYARELLSAASGHRDWNCTMYRRSCRKRVTGPGPCHAPDVGW